jgi:hypothetical protein
MLWRYWMKKLFFVLFILLVSGAAFCIEADLSDLNIEIGNVRISRPFVHADKDFEKGIYWITLTSKEGIPYFNVHNQKKELLFEELAIIKPYQTKNKKMKYRVTKGIIGGGEYYRIKVKKPGAMIMGYFLIKKAEPPQPKEQPQEAEKKEG